MIWRRLIQRWRVWRLSRITRRIVARRKVDVIA